MEDKTIVLIILMVAVQVTLMIINLVDLSRKAKTRYLNKAWWLAIILLGSMIGNIAYIAIESNGSSGSKKR